jgi:Protein of unknown function (DUF3313)
MRTVIQSRPIAVLLPLVGLLMLAGCSATVAPSPNVIQRVSGEAPAPHGSGFLGDYSQLKPGTGEQPQWVYNNPQADWTKYTKVMLDPVTFLALEQDNVAQKDQRWLCDYFYNSLKEQLSTKFTIVDQPGPGVMRVQMALTDASGAVPVLRTVSVLVPQARVANMVQSLASGSYAFVGSATAEVQITDSVTGERLAAYMDKRLGGMAFKSAAQWKWGDAQTALDYWSKKLADRLAEFQSGKVRPPA